MDKQIVVDGHFVSEKVSRIVAAIKEYCPELEVQYIPVGSRRQEQAAFRIIHNPVGQEPYTIFHVKDEGEFDARVLKKLIAGDQRGGELKYSDVEAADRAAALVAKQIWEDERDEAIDKMWHMFNTPLNTYKIDKDTIMKEGIPFNAKDY